MNWMNIKCERKIVKRHFFLLFLNKLNEQIAILVTELLNESVGWKRKKALKFQTIKPFCDNREK